jgi:hypothetical protein
MDMAKFFQLVKAVDEISDAVDRHDIHSYETRLQFAQLVEEQTKAVDALVDFIIKGSA